jgi:undecaprenyl diphosphate synthase
LQHKVPEGLDRKESEVYRKLDPARLPKHIAIIMDGNGRWAKRRHMPRVAGHRAGVTSVRSTVETAARIHMPALTLYAFSEENWKKRPTSEVGFLMGLLSRYLKAEVPTLNKNNIRLEYIGRQHELPEDVQERMAWARAATGEQLRHGADAGAQLQRAQRTGGCVPLHGERGGAERRIEHLRIDEDMVSRHLYTRHLPDPDLVVRTSGEMRLE